MLVWLSMGSQEGLSFPLHFQKQNEEFAPLQQKVLLLESLLQTSEDRSTILEKQLEELNSSVATREAALKEAAESQKLELERQIDELRMEMEMMKTVCGGYL